MFMRDAASVIVLSVFASSLSAARPQVARAEPEVHLLPAGFSGLVTIAFGALNGSPAAREGDARLYRIPSNGVLLTQEDWNYGISPEWKFFSVSAAGERDSIARIWTSTVPETVENRANPSVAIFYPVRVRFGPGLVPCEVEALQYFVGTRAQLSSRNSQLERRQFQDVLKTSYVCR